MEAIVPKSEVNLVDTRVEAEDSEDEFVDVETVSVKEFTLWSQPEITGEFKPCEKVNKVDPGCSPLEQKFLPGAQDSFSSIGQKPDPVNSVPPFQAKCEPPEEKVGALDKEKVMPVLYPHFLSSDFKKPKTDYNFPSQNAPSASTSPCVAELSRHVVIGSRKLSHATATNTGQVHSQLTSLPLASVELDDRHHHAWKPKFWCKKCDRYYPTLEALRHHIVAKHNMKCDHVNYLNVATWDMFPNLYPDQETMDWINSYNNRNKK